MFQGMSRTAGPLHHPASGRHGACRPCIGDALGVASWTATANREAHRGKCASSAGRHRRNDSEETVRSVQDLV